MMMGPKGRKDVSFIRFMPWNYQMVILTKNLPSTNFPDGFGCGITNSIKGRETESKDIYSSRLTSEKVQFREFLQCLLHRLKPTFFEFFFFERSDPKGKGAFVVMKKSS